MSSAPKLSPYKLHLLQQFADAKGARWKAELRQLWATPPKGTTGTEAEVELYALRVHGLAWLKRFTLPRQTGQYRCSACGVVFTGELGKARSWFLLEHGFRVCKAATRQLEVVR